MKDCAVPHGAVCVTGKLQTGLILLLTMYSESYKIKSDLRLRTKGRAAGSSTDKKCDLKRETRIRKHSRL